MTGTRTQNTAVKPLHEQQMTSFLSWLVPLLVVGLPASGIGIAYACFGPAAVNRFFRRCYYSIRMWACWSQTNRDKWLRSKITKARDTDDFDAIARSISTVNFPMSCIDALIAECHKHGWELSESLNTGLLHLLKKAAADQPAATVKRLCPEMRNHNTFTDALANCFVSTSSQVNLVEQDNEYCKCLADTIAMCPIPSSYLAEDVDPPVVYNLDDVCSLASVSAMNNWTASAWHVVSEMLLHLSRRVVRDEASASKLMYDVANHLPSMQDLCFAHGVELLVSLTLNLRPMLALPDISEALGRRIAEVKKDRRLRSVSHIPKLPCEIDMFISITESIKNGTPAREPSPTLSNRRPRLCF